MNPIPSAIQLFIFLSPMMAGTFFERTHDNTNHTYISGAKDGFGLYFQIPSFEN